mmetsp:Transcript_2717/g.4433  ORF Transcript_2717/g.4433 Transcript_2717/m.4433 type:complete len:104 (+) Transcript_2717:846-1157(+)
MVKRWQRNSGTGWVMGSLVPSDDEDEDDFRLRLLGAPSDGGRLINNSSSEQLDTTVAPEQSGTSSRRSPHSMVAGRTSAETSGKESSWETRLREEEAWANMIR